METSSLGRFSALKLNEQKTLRNRVVVPPMASGTADAQGYVTEKTLGHYSRLTDSGAGLVFAEYTYVHSSGRSEDNQLGAWADDQIPGLKRLAAIMRQNGALAGLQITHAGGKADSDSTGGQLMSPSGIAVPVKDRELEKPKAMSLEDIELWKLSFEAAAARAAAAGFDAVEFHSAHGYGLNQWLSPITNRRSDKYGKDAEGRRRLLIEIVTAVRARFPELLISARIPGQDFLDGGLTVEDGVGLALALEGAGASIIHVSSGIGGWRRPSPRIGEGYLVTEAGKIQRHVRIPVIGVGGIETGEYIDRKLREGEFSLAAVGRAILNDPQGWYKKNLAS